ncbi:MAG TPA: hypothetical protein P5328_01310 [Candidatus Paceibacterota bacterium]|nr:hypothetical protein [Candidatus Paceibacterota bacterium]HRZ34722.1 hypothetical protein [Candidatus Paceibacterota bacterium]
MNDVNSVDVLTDILRDSFVDVWRGVVAVLPQIIIAIIIVIIGWLVGAALAKVIAQIVRAVKLDKALSSAGLGDLLQKAGFQLNSGRFIGELVKWFTIVVFLIAAFNVLGLTDVNAFLTDTVVNYIPRVIAAVLIVLIAVIVADVLKKAVIATAKAAELKAANFLGSITKWAIWIVAITTAIVKVGILEDAIISIFLMPILWGIALAVGLAFGLGGKDAAARLIERVGREVSERD